MGIVNQIEIYQAEVEKEVSDNTYQIKLYWKTEESAQKYQGKYLVELKKSTEIVKSEEVQDKNCVFSNIQLDDKLYYTVSVTVKDQPDKSHSTPLLLKTYERLTGSYDGSSLELSWDKPDINIGSGKCIVKVDHSGIYTYEISPYVCGMEIPMEEKHFGEKINLTVTMQPYINKFSSGPSAEIPSLFCPVYTAEESAEGKKQVCFRKQGMDEKILSIPLDGEIYAADQEGKLKKPESPISSGSLELGIVSPYMLTIRSDTVLERADYDTFIAKVFQVTTTKAMYQIMEMIARGARQNIEDMLYFHCGLNPDKRCTDVRPGFSLKLEQELYMPEDQMSGGDAAGFVGNHTAFYEVSLARGKNMEYLEFDSFVHLMEEEIYPPSSEETVKPVGAGIIDLCAVRMRQPFYRIQYPEALFSSEAEPDIYAGNHVLMLAAPGFQEVPLPPENSTVVPYLLFRGRSALTLQITVVVCGVERKLPAGTTVGKMMGFMGIHGKGAKKLVLYRRSPSGEQTKISFSGEIWEDFPLFHGDRIEG